MGPDECETHLRRLLNAPIDLLETEREAVMRALLLVCREQAVGPVESAEDAGDYCKFLIEWNAERGPIWSEE